MTQITDGGLVIFISEFTLRFRNRDTEFCLPQEERNPVRMRSQQILAFRTFAGAPVPRGLQWPYRRHRILTTVFCVTQRQATAEFRTAKDMVVKSKHMTDQCTQGRGPGMN